MVGEGRVCGSLRKISARDKKFFIRRPAAVDKKNKGKVREKLGRRSFLIVENRGERSYAAEELENRDVFSFKNFNIIRAGKETHSYTYTLCI